MSQDSEDLDERTPLTSGATVSIYHQESVFDAPSSLVPSTSAQNPKTAEVSPAPEYQPSHVPSHLEELPQHILVNIFEFLVETYSPSNHKIVHHTLEKGQRFSRARNTKPKPAETDNFDNFSKAQTKFNLVCRSFYEAASSDVLWKGISHKLYRSLAVRAVINENEIFSPANRSNMNPRTVVKSNVKIIGKARNKLRYPASEYKQFYIQLKKQQTLQYKEYVKFETYQSKALKKLHWVESGIDKYFILLFILAMLLLDLFLVGLTVHQALEKFTTLPVSRYYYWITFSPVLLFLFFLFSLPIILTLSHFYDTYSNTYSFNVRRGAGCDCTLLWMIIVIFLVVGALVYLTLGSMLNVAAFPYLSTFYGIADPFHSSWDRRIHLIPWLVIFIPIFLIMFLLSAAFTFLFLEDNMRVIRDNTRPLIQRLREVQTGGAIGTFAVLMVEAFFVILGIKLEMPKVTAFSIAYCFIPLHLLGFIIIGIAIYAIVERVMNGGRINCSNYSKTEFVMGISLMIFAISIEVAFILTSCYETIIGPFVWISWIPCVTSFFIWAVCNTLD